MDQLLKYRWDLWWRRWRGIKISEDGGVASSVSSDIVDMRYRLGITHLKLNVHQPFVFFIYNARQDFPVSWGKLPIPQGAMEHKKMK